jgi:hypothetical protein
MPGRSFDIKLADHLYTPLSRSKRCQYCGELATTMDHFIPISIAAQLLRIGVRLKNLFLLPACLECNVLAGDEVFDSIEEKRKFIQDKLSKRYKSVLRIPYWKHHEVAELGYNLKHFIISGIGQHRIIIRRLEWQGEKIEESEENASIVIPNFTQLENGSSSVKEIVNKNGIMKRRSSSLSMLRVSGQVKLKSEQTVEELEL